MREQMGKKLSYKEVLYRPLQKTNLHPSFSYFDIKCVVKAFFLVIEALIIILMFCIAEL